VKILQQTVSVACHLLGPDALINEAIQDQHDHGEVAAEPLVKLPHTSVIPGQEADGLHDEHGASLWTELKRLELVAQAALQLYPRLFIIHWQALLTKQIKEVEHHIRDLGQDMQERMLCTNP
jgi:hypothetical protein